MEKITLCGDDCLQCPRYLAKTTEEKNKVAELWHRIGWRDKIVSPEEISCEGCSSHKVCAYVASRRLHERKLFDSPPSAACAYNLVECVKENGVEKCNQHTPTQASGYVVLIRYRSRVSSLYYDASVGV